MARPAPRPRPDAAADPAVVARPDGAEPTDVAEPTDAGTDPAAPGGRGRKPSGGVSVIAGGLLQDLEARLRRELPPIEERVRTGEELRGVSAGPGGAPADPLVVVLPPAAPRQERRQT